MKTYEQKYLLLKEKVENHYKSELIIEDNLLIPSSFYELLEQKPINYQYAYLRLLFEINNTEKKMELNSNYFNEKFFGNGVLSRQNDYVYVIYDKEGNLLCYNLEDFIFETDKKSISLISLIMKSLPLVANKNSDNLIWDKIKGGENSLDEINTMIVKHLYLNPVKESCKSNAAESKLSICANFHTDLTEWKGIFSAQCTHLRLHSEGEKPKSNLSSYLERFYKEREENRSASKSGLLINNFAFDCIYRLECIIGIDEKDRLYKHVLELYSQGVSTNDDTEQTARFKQHLNKKNLILINSLLNLIYKENSNHVELHQLIKDLYTFEAEANKYLKLLADASSKNDPDKKAELVQMQESIRLKGLDLQNKMKQICPKTNSDEYFASLKGIALCITGIVILVLGSALSPLSPPMALIATAATTGFFTYGVSYLIPKYSPKVDRSDYDNAVSNLDEIVGMNLK